MTYANGHPGLGLGQTQKCGGIKLVNEITTTQHTPSSRPLDNWISSVNTGINKQ